MRLSLMVVVPMLLSMVDARPAAAQTPPPAGVMPMVAALLCGPDELTVVIQRDVARVTFRGQRHEMTAVPAASGAKYEVAGDPSTSFWSKGASGTLTVAGTTYPECTPRGAAAPAAPVASRRGYSATGNEPGWRLDIAASGALTLVTDNGATTTRIARPVRQREGGDRRYRGRAEGREVLVHLRAAPCVDSMTGQPRPDTVEITLGVAVLKGCGGDPAALLHGAAWQIVEVAGAPVIDGSRPTVQFTADGRVAGSASCNNYRGTYTITPEGLSILKPAATMRACTPVLMAQEQVVLAVLASVTRFSFAGDGALVLEAGDGRRLVARRSPP